MCEKAVKKERLWWKLRGITGALGRYCRMASKTEELEASCFNPLETGHMRQTEHSKYLIFLKRVRDLFFCTVDKFKSDIYCLSPQFSQPWSQERRVLISTGQHRWLTADATLVTPGTVACLQGALPSLQCWGSWRIRVEFQGFTCTMCA